MEFPTRRKERNHTCLSLLPRSQGLSEFLTHSCSTWRDKDTFSSGLTKKRSASQSRLTVREQGGSVLPPHSNFDRNCLANLTLGPTYLFSFSRYP